MADSTHRVDVIEVKLEEHPNADSLSVVLPMPGCTVCVRTDDWNDGDLGAYIQADSIVPEGPKQFEFLRDSKGNFKGRIKVKKLRGVYSMGMLVPAPDGSKVGDDVAEDLDVTHYEPPIPQTMRGEAKRAPEGLDIPKYDIENLRKYAEVFEDGESVFVTEKLHGANSRFLWHEGEMWCGSRKEWKKEDDSNMWWKVLRDNPSIEEHCRNHKGSVLFGEVYGSVQDLKYGAKPGEVMFAAFDVFEDGKYLDVEEAQARSMMYNIPWVPILGIGLPFNLDDMLKLAEGDTRILGADNIREGIVVKPLEERWNKYCGRLALKIVSNKYLEGSK